MTTKKRVCIVRFNYYPADLLVLREATTLRDAGFDVDVICMLGNNQARQEMVDGVQVHRMPIHRKKQGVIRYIFEYLAFFILVASHLTVMHLKRPFAVIQVNNMPDFLIFATLIPYLLGAKAILQMYEPMPELWATKFDSRLLFVTLQFIEQLALRYVHAVFAVTQALKENFVARGADAAKITVVLNVSDPITFASYRTFQQTVPTNGHFTLICHGAIEERYGHDTMIEAIAQIREQIPNICLNILGSGSYLNEFLRLVEQAGLQETIHYWGFVPLAQMVQAIETADVGLVAQKANAYSHLVHTGKMYDYLEFGKPVIASRLRATQAYFDEESIQFFEPGNAADLARAILDLYHHPDKRARLAQRACQLREQYSWASQHQNYVAVYYRLAGKA